MNEHVKTPTLDKYGLHPFGGRCTCYSSPYTECVICKKCAEATKRWEALSPKIRERAKREIDMKYATESADR